MSAEQLRPILTVYISHFHIYFPVWHCSAHRENTGCADLSTFGQGAVRLKQLCTEALIFSLSSTVSLTQLTGPLVRIINSGYPSELSR